MVLDLLFEERYQREGIARQGGGRGSVGLPPATSFISMGVSSIGRGKALRSRAVSSFNIAGDPPVHSLVVVVPLPPGVCP
jgi:hypothetical protein